MREILFRGKRIDNGEWVYGSYMYWNDNTGNPFKHTTKERHYIYAYSCTDFNLGGWSEEEVDLSTIGQYTRLQDKNDKKIFEGDIVRVLGGIYEQGFYEINETTIVKDIIKDGYEIMTVISQLGKNCIEIIGNIHDNPELLEV